MAPDPSDLPIDPTGTILSSDQTALLSYLVWICGKFDLYRLTEPANSRHLTNVVLMLADRLRRWTNVKPTLVERLVFSRAFVVLSSIYAWYWIGYDNPNQHWMVVQRRLNL